MPVRLSKPDVRRGLRISTWEGAFADLCWIPISGAFLTGYALAWGASDFQIGLLNTVFSLAAPFHVVGAYLVDRWPQWRREMVAYLGLFSRASWFLIAVIPFMTGGAPSLTIPCVLALFFLSSIALNANGPAWIAWMAVLVPPRLRGTYYGQRMRLIEGVCVIASLAAGVALDAFRIRGFERPGFAIMQLLVGVAGIVCFVLILNQPDPGHCTPPPELHWRYFVAPLREPDFRCLVIFSLTWCFGMNIGTPFMSAHLLKNLHWDFKQLSVLGIACSLAMILTSAQWGKLADRFGAKAVLKICWFGILHLPLYYIFCPAEAHWPIYVSGVLNGVFLGGFNLAIFSLTLGGLPTRSRAMGSAILNGATGPVIFLSGALGGWLAGKLGVAPWRLGSFDFNNYQLLLIICILLRIPTFLLLRRIHKPRKPPCRPTISLLNTSKTKIYR